MIDDLLQLDRGYEKGPAFLRGLCD
jgi:hypothetical protein